MNFIIINSVVTFYNSGVCIYGEFNEIYPISIKAELNPDLFSIFHNSHPPNPYLIAKPK